MRDELDPVLGKQSQKPLKDAADNNSPHQHTHTLSGTYGKGYGEKCETDTHHNGETGSDTPDRIKLDEGTDTSDDHTVLYQGGTDSWVNAHDIRQNDNRCDIGNEHCQHVL